MQMLRRSAGKYCLGFSGFANFFFKVLGLEMWMESFQEKKKAFVMHSFS